MPTAPEHLADSSPEEQELVSSQPSQPSHRDAGMQPQTADAAICAAEGSACQRSADPQRLLLPAPGSWPASVPGTVAPRVSAADAASVAAEGGARPAVSAQRPGKDSAQGARRSATAEALRQQQRSARSLSLAEYFLKRRATLNPEDSFRIFCQVRGDPMFQPFS